MEFLKSKKHGACIIIICCLTATSYNCGNPAIVRYLSPHKPAEGSSQKADQKNPRRFLIHEENGISVYLENANAEHIQEAAIMGNSDKLEFRIPPLTYLRFMVKNRSEKPLTFNLFDTILNNGEGENYPVVREAKFRDAFTSEAYAQFSYIKIFAFYTVLYQDKKNKGKPYFQKHDPGESVYLEPGYTGYQIIPFAPVSEKHLTYSLLLPFKESNPIPLDFVIYRTDHKKRQD